MNIKIPNNKKEKNRLQSSSRLELIVNADDFGESSLVNEAIMQAFGQGILTSTSLMVTGDGFEEAVELARLHPELRIGLHIVLVGGERSCLPRHAIPDLVDADGRFPPNPIAASKQWLMKGVGEQIRREVRAQMERFRETGLPLDHINGHFHFHMHPQIFPALLEVAEEVGSPHIRLPIERLWPAFALDRSDLRRKLGYIFKFNIPALYYRQRLQARGVRTIDGVFGVFQTGYFNEAYLLELLKKIPAGRYELYAHPRLDNERGLCELNALTAPTVRQMIEERNILLTSYSELR